MSTDSYEGPRTTRLGSTPLGGTESKGASEHSDLERRGGSVVSNVRRRTQ